MKSAFQHPTSFLGDQLYFGMTPVHLSELTQKHGTPFYLYDLDFFRARLSFFSQSVPPGSWVAFALKANTYPGFLNQVKELGAGVDVVSGGELAWALQHGVDAKKIVFSGVGKSEKEIHQALDANIGLINVESWGELKKIARIAEEKKISASIGLRLNPDLDVKTHPYISTGLKENKFGIPVEEFEMYVDFLKQHPRLHLKSLSHHLGSQMMDLSPIKESFDLFLRLFQEAKKHFIHLEYLDVGGGLGIEYETQNLEREEKNFSQYLSYLQTLHTAGAKLIFEPGRFLVGHAGVLIAQVMYIKKNKERNFLILDTGSHHLVRPMLYGSYHHILPLKWPKHSETEIYDVVGPLCESSDFLAKQRSLPKLEEGDFVAILDVCAYGAVMASQYNLREKPAEFDLQSLVFHL